ncbi:hypothetical protein P153DRAFT_369319 [Dothidotthia symphoricarpi CBS 119687]|uniref:Uncharacterized protein n=1 Tax=Dothidotthia symphoricarpi CBS 119687 TaxID=1392245 RepID=A0A6A6A434_9PLEO|nr:uncharacterized protein P153DRAFT_369319 [Dothidotthia symphoricarpi CBS 119687]KAF2126649.1 hypothetical protein P153DRAFT_369319 [Dothidotthia symphoricarpi CBS 119687]
MASAYGFFKLPRELRDAIYGFYFTTEDGYHLNLDSGKLTVSNRQPIDLSLRLVCRIITQETIGVPFNMNTINFTTVDSDKLPKDSQNIHDFVHALHTLKAIALTLAKSLITPNILRDLLIKHHQYETIMQEMMAAGDDSGLLRYYRGDVPSHYRRFIADSLDTLARQPNFVQVVATKTPSYDRCIRPLSDILEVLSVRSYEPWSIPTDQIVLRRPQSLYSFACYALVNRRSISNNRFSAAAVAIRYLESLSTETRLQIKRINLHEDRISLAFPECHMQGLIPFCNENPRLHIHRQVSVWKNVLPAGSTTYSTNYFTTEEDEWYDPDSVRLHAGEISNAVKPWIAEALALPTLGMRSSSFSFTFDCDAASNCTTKVFEVMLQDAAWHMAMEKAYRRDLARGITPNSYVCEQVKLSCRGFLQQALRDIKNKRSIIQCNFPLGDVLDPDTLLDDDQSWSQSRWEQHCVDYKRLVLASQPPLPSWYDIRRLELDVDEKVLTGNEQAEWDLSDQAVWQQKGLGPY